MGVVISEQIWPGLELLPQITISEIEGKARHTPDEDVLLVFCLYLLVVVVVAAERVEPITRRARSAPPLVVCAGHCISTSNNSLFPAGPN